MEDFLLVYLKTISKFGRLKPSLVTLCLAYYYFYKQYHTFKQVLEVEKVQFTIKLAVSLEPDTKKS